MPPRKKATPKGKGAKTAATAAMIWTILVKTGWLPIWAMVLSLPRDFFYDEYIAGVMGIFIGWLMRELKEFIGNPTLFK